MKGKRIAILLFIMAFSLFSISGFSQDAAPNITVKVKPQVPQYQRGPQPSPKHVWIDEEWQARGNQYVFVGGKWYVPPHPNYNWVFGHWKHHPNGWEWVNGYWKKNEGGEEK